MPIKPSHGSKNSKPGRRRKQARYLAIGYLILLTGLLLAPRPFDPLGPFAPAAQRLVGPGYWVHFALYFALGTLLLWAFGRGEWRSFLLLMLLVAVHGTVIESFQGLVPGREVDFFDVVSNLFGGFLAGGTWIVARPRPRAN